MTNMLSPLAYFPKNAENVQVQLYSKKGKTEAEVKV